MKITESFNLALEPYCEYCPGFEPDVDKTDVTCFGDKVPKAIITISCCWGRRCENAVERVKNYEKSKTV